MVNTKVISIASVSGGGKTTLTNALSNRLRNAEALFFDNYDFKGEPEDLVGWVEEGPDYNQWKLDPLLSDMKSLQQQEDPPEYILLDYPFSYLNDQLRSVIDVSLYIDTPLDIAMARRLIRDYSHAESMEIHNDLNHYLKYGRRAYVEMETTIKQNADRMVDGSLPVSQMVETVLRELKKNEI
ncbi:hypothetical protein [Halobacillus halophilus]|uniref:hypothetical protein n=1 Tax=Halobacillus halophilus TaxID=1570 RepID=UPI001CD44E0C|nr:hypothetical protein [Halobacillus halophilus]MCA1011595.1 hypothetical protein [Halobacillus halophilus]